MSIGIFTPFRGTMLKRITHRLVFVMANPGFMTKKPIQCGCITTPGTPYVCARFQHKEVDLTINKTRRAGTEVSANDEKLIEKVSSQMGPVFPLKQLTKSAKIFETIAATSPNAEGFGKAIETFKKQDVKRLRVMDFISTAVTYMEPFGVAKNVDSYNHLLDLFPKGRYHNRNAFDTLWTRYRPQIDCAVHVLTKLEENRIRPNVHTYDIIHAVFGNDSIPLNKLRRIVFWFDKFDEMYPDPLPKELPENQQELFEMAINQITDDRMTISAVVCKDENGIEHQIFGAENKNLSAFLEEYDLAKPIFVEGPQIVWLRKTRIHYYLLKADVNPNHIDEDNILAMCILGKDEGEAELKLWIKELQNNYPKLAQLNIIFNIHSNDKL